MTINFETFLLAFKRLNSTSPSLNGKFDYNSIHKGIGAGTRDSDARAQIRQWKRSTIVNRSLLEMHQVTDRQQNKDTTYWHCFCMAQKIAYV